MSNDHSLTVKRTINADRETVYKALTDQGLMEKWFFAGPDGGSATVSGNIAEEGSEYQIDMHGDNETYTHTGNYREVVPNEKLVFTWNSHAVEDTLVTISLRDVDGGTEVVLTHEFLPSEKMVNGHTEGWTLILQRLDGVVADQ